MSPTATLLEPTPVPEIFDGMTVRVVYLGQQKMRYRFLDQQGRAVVPEFYNGDSGQWQDEPCTCTEPYADSRGQPKLIYDGIRYRLECGKDQYMPIEAARLWFGDERAKAKMDTGVNRHQIREWVDDRATIVRRLRTLYDNRVGDDATIYGHPIVEVYTVDEGARVPMVLDDPLGTNSTPAALTQAEETDLRKILARQQAALAKLQREVDAQNSTPPRGRAPAPKPREDAEPDDTATVPINQLPEDPNA